MILDHLPALIKSFLSEIETLGFKLTLVGGSTRDFLFLDTLGFDLDFEIRANHEIKIEEWPLYYKKLHLFLEKKGLAFNELPYLITRVSLGEYKCEFSSPRTEKNREGVHGHHHFDARMDSNLDHTLSFLRRDFTINAIGYELNLKEETVTLIDPYGGSQDLKKGVLKNITDSFYCDSVRFLRLVRFQIKFSRFVIEENLYKNIPLFNLTELSRHHFTEELFKSEPGKFLSLFAKLVRNNFLKLPEAYTIWLTYTFPEHLNSKESLLAYIFLQDEDDALKASHFFSLPEKKFKDLKSFFHSYEVIKNAKEIDFLKILSLPLEVALAQPLLKEMKNLDEKKSWRTYMAFALSEKELLVDWNSWTGITVSSEEIERVPPPLRSFYPFYCALKKVFTHD
jgi:tRNA nucleotidyltransferase (CCA-adding enzyme)